MRTSLSSCPHCGAPEGAPCTSSTGHTLQSSHKARWQQIAEEFLDGTRVRRENLRQAGEAAKRERATARQHRDAAETAALRSVIAGLYVLGPDERKAQLGAFITPLQLAYRTNLAPERVGELIGTKYGVRNRFRRGYSLDGLMESYLAQEREG